MPWRMRPPEDWPRRLEALNAGIAELQKAAGAESEDLSSKVAVEARLLANMRLSDVQRVKLGRSIKKLWDLRSRLPALRPFRMLALSNRTLAWFAADLSVAAPARGLLVHVSEGKFDSVSAVAMGAVRPDPNAQLDAVLVFLDHDGFLAPKSYLASAEESQAVAAAVSWLASTATSLRERLWAPVILATLPVPPEHIVASSDRATAGALSRFIGRINEEIFAGAGRGDWIVWDVAQLASEVGTHAWFDPVRLHQSKAPFAIEFCPVAADHLCRTIAAMCGKTGRALVLDLDNTLWGGVIADDGLEGIRVGQGSPEGEAYIAFQRVILDLRSRGVVLAVCSKNEDAIAREVFARHPDMLLRLEQFSFFQANWADKATNLKALAECLRLGYESIVFVDDNPAERARIRQTLPLVMVPELGEDPAWFGRILMASGYFEHLLLGADDLKRGNSYTSLAQRAPVVSDIGNYDEYLASLRMQMTLSSFDGVGRGRIVQLINKSNQFNLTTRRYNDAEIRTLEADPSVLKWQVRLSDTFGDHGMIAVVIVRKGLPAWTIDTWLMSCRVMERGVEQAIMNELVAAARAANIAYIEGTYLRTDRNRVVEDFFPRMGFEKKNDGPENGRSAVYRLEVDRFRPFQSFIEVSTRQ